MTCLVNGHATDVIAIADRGLQYGDGVFETITIENARPQFWDRHMARLQAGCERLAISTVDPARLFAEARQLFQEAGWPNAIAKLIVTRGSGGRGYGPPRPATTPTRIVQLFPWPHRTLEQVKQGISVRLCRTRLGENPALAGIKHLNRLEQVLARSEWEDDEYQEGLLLDQHDRIIEGTMSNVFIVKDRQLKTPALERCGVAGVIRGCVLDLARDLEMDTAATDLRHTDLASADEIFITNSLLGICPVRRYEKQALAAGAVTRRLADRLANWKHSTPETFKP